LINKRSTTNIMYKEILFYDQEEEYFNKYNYLKESDDKLVMLG